MSSPYMTTREVAERFRVSTKTISHWRRIGRIRGVSPGGRTGTVLYPRTEIEEFERRLLAEAGLLDQD